jgi:phage-related protein
VGILATGAASFITWLNNAGLLVPVLATLLAVTKGWTLAVNAAKIAMAAWAAVMGAFNVLTDFETVALKAMYAWDLLVTIATKAWAVAQAILDAALDANPIGLIVLAIAALVGGLILAFQHSAAFRDVLIGAWHGIQVAWSAAVSFFAKVGDALVSAWHAVTAAWGVAASFFSGIVASVVAVFTGLADAVTGEFDKIMTFVTGSFDTWWASNGEAIKKIWSALWGAITAVAGAVWSVITAVAKAGWQVLVSIFTVEADIAKAIWSAYWSALSAVASAVFGVITAVVRAAWGVLTAIFTAEVRIVEAVWSAWWTSLQAVASAAWTILTNGVRVAWAAVQLVFTVTMAILQAAWSVWWSVLKAAAAVFWAAIQAAVKIAWDILVGIFTVAINLLTGNWHGAWVAMQTMFTQVWNAIEAFARVVLAAISSVITTAWTSVENATRTIFNGISSFFTTWWNAVKGDFSAAVGAVKTVLGAAWTAISNTAQAAFNGLKSALSSIWSGITSVLEAPVRAVVSVVINPFIGGLDTVLSWVGIPGIPKIPGFRAGGMIRNLAAGGRLPGYGGGDRRMIMAEDGETVVSKSTSRAMAPLFSAYGVPGYATGGIVGGILSAIPGASGVVDIAKFVGGGVLDAINTIEGAAGKIASVVGAGNWPGAIGAIARKVVTAPITKVEDLVKNKIIGPVTSFLSSLLAPSPGSPGAIAQLSGGAAAAQRYAQGLVASLWPNSAATNFTALVQLWNGESGWNYQAENPSSGAYGIPQSLPADKMASAGSDWRTNAATQIRWGLGYIQSVYGSPSAAYSAWLSRNPHWYSKGGPVGPYGGAKASVRRYTNGGPIPEMVFGLGASGNAYQFHQGEEVTSAAMAATTSRQLDALIGAVKDLTAVTAAVPGGVGQTVGGAINGAAGDASFAARYRKAGW